MLIPTLPGWKVETIGDDIAWMKFGSDGRLYAVNPEAGFFGVAPGTGVITNPNAIDTIGSNSIFTNCAQTDDGDVWWEALTAEPPAHAIDWRGNDWTPESEPSAAHPNARFTTPAAQCPSIAPEWEDPSGVPIEAMLFGGRRSSVVPLVHEARDWEHGVFLGSTMSSETTAAAAGKVGRLRWDPMAMLPFCGYHMADYFRHWLNIGQRDGAKPPRIFYVNWFRKDEDGKFLWPGYGDNSRVLAWVFRRCEGNAAAVETPIGLVPPLGEGGIDTDGLDISDEAMTKLLEVDIKGWKHQLPADARALRGVRREAPGRTARAARATGRAPARRLDHPNAHHSTNSRPCPTPRPMTRSIVKLPRDVGEEFEVYVNGVLQQPDLDFYVDRRALLFERPLRKDHVSGWRWLLGAWGVGTYRQDDTVDVRYEHDGEMRVAHALAITVQDEQPDGEH